jgi:adenylyltransferase/sulfurtransferase
MGSVCGVLGSLQATEIIKEICSIGESLAGKMLIYNGLDLKIRLTNLVK